MGDIMGQIGQFGSSLLSGAQTLGSDVMTGIQDVGSSLGGLFGGGGAVSPGTIGAAGANIASGAPSALGAGVDTAANVVDTGGQTAASMMAGPGALDTSTIASGLPAVTGINANPGTIIGGFSDPSTAGILGQPGVQAITGLNTDLASSGVPGVQAITAPDAALAPGITANPTMGGNFLQKLLANPKLLAEGGLLGAELLNANKTPAGEAQLKALAASQGAFAKNQGELAQAEQQGLLPAGATNLFQGQLNAAEAAIRAKYAQMGMTGSSAEMQDLAAAREGIMGQMFQQGQQMAAQGWTNVNQATGYQSQLLDEILASETAQGTQLGQALAAFAGAAAK